VYVFLGAEPHRRETCRRALIDKVLQEDEREHGLARFDLRETSLSSIVDEARSPSLFATRRLIWVSNAEAALPRGRSAGSEDEQAVDGNPIDPLMNYLERPAPEVVVVLDVSRYGLEGEDKAKLERVRKFYSGVPAQVEFPPYSTQEARHLAAELVQATGLRMDSDGIEALVESVGADAMRIATEIEKLALYGASGKKIGIEELAMLVPDSSVSTAFVLVDALGRRDRMRALELLDTLVRQGEYMPLALSFLASLFRLALAAKERGLRSPQQIQQELSRTGRPIWRSRAEQIHQTSTVFSKSQLETALGRIFAADRGLRDARPDDRIVMERLILGLAD
jgi:DNA polymerase III subunit delta